MVKAIKFFDCFSGIGGFRSGLEKAGGFECVGYCEIDKYKKSRLESTLKSAGIKMTPETFTALALLKAFCIAALAIPCAFFMPLLFQRPFNILNAAYLQTAEYNKKTVTPYF